MPTDNLRGLDEEEASRRLKAEGWNELPSAKPRSFWRIAWTVLREPMLLLLLACGGIYLILGSRQDAVILLGSVFVVIGMSIWQERKTERTLEALRDLSSPRALVIRDGQQKRIAGRDVVRGDLILLSEGDRVPADAWLLVDQGLVVDESLLTGESMPVRKAPVAEDDAISGQAGGDDSPNLFSGTLVVQGKGWARVLTTGADSAIGKIGRALSTLGEEPSRIQLETARVVKQVAVSSLALVLLLAGWYGFTRQDWLNAILAGLTLAMGILPQEFPLVLVIFLGLGAWRIAKNQVLMRRIPAVETLGEATVLCVDKTGTLTQNRMSLASIVSHGEMYSFGTSGFVVPDAFPEVFHETLEFAMLSSQRDPVDPMERAIREAGTALLHGSEHIHESWNLVEEYPLSPELLAMSRVWASRERDHFVIAAKGAPEAIVDLCHLGEDMARRIANDVDKLASQGLRVLAVAKASFHDGNLPPIQHDFAFEFLGLIALADPLRSSVREAVAECRAAGIRVVMITGDYPATALSIARQAGLDAGGGLLTGADLEKMKQEDLLRHIRTVSIFCRVSAEQKLHLVETLKTSGEIVAMTGDGVNDAPALKAAHIGIAMGGRGTDVAREASAMVLLNDDFSSIVLAARLGRRIFDNIRKAIVFIIAVHIPIAGLSLLPVMLGWPLILLPVHIVFFELMVDPACTIVFEAEPEEQDVMRRPPRPTDAKIFDAALLGLGLRQGSALLVLLLAILWLAQSFGLTADQARMLAFSAMIVGDIWLILINRSWTLSLQQTFSASNTALWWVLSGTLLMLGAALLVAPISNVFRFAAVPLQHFLAVIIGVMILLAGLSNLRFFRHIS